MDGLLFNAVTGDAGIGETKGERTGETTEVHPEAGALAGTGASDTREDASVSEGEDEAEESIEAYRKRAEEWERRFKGLQARVQKEVEARRSLELERARLEAQLQQILIQQQLEQLPEEERQVAAQQVYADMALRERVAQLAYAESHLQELAKHLVVMTLSQRYGVPAERLYQINDPYAMEMVAKELAHIRRQAAKSQRKAAQADRFESAGAGAPPKEPETFEDAVEGIMRALQGA